MFRQTGKFCIGITEMIREGSAFLKSVTAVILVWLFPAVTKMQIP
jgi:hypothetical protein